MPQRDTDGSHAEAIGVRPAHVKATSIVDLVFGVIWPYLPPDLPIRPDWGRFSAHVALLYDAADGFRTDADLKVADLTFSRQGTRIRWLRSLTSCQRARACRQGRHRHRGSPCPGHRRFDRRSGALAAQAVRMGDARLALENVTYPQGPPANVTLTMNLPAGATLDIRGTAAAEPLAANLIVTLGGVDLSLINPYVSSVSPITISRGRSVPP